jgi:hypothetical protein
MRPTDTTQEGDGKGDTRMVPHDWNTIHVDDDHDAIYWSSQFDCTRDQFDSSKDRSWQPCPIDLLHQKNKTGWNRSAWQKFNPLPTPINDLRVSGLTLSIEDGDVVHLFSTTCAFVGDRHGVAVLRDHAARPSHDFTGVLNDCFRRVVVNLLQSDSVCIRVPDDNVFGSIVVRDRF